MEKRANTNYIKAIGHYVFSVPEKLRRHFEKPKNKWPTERLVMNLKKGYLHDHGRELNMDNPVLFTEKLQWYKVFYDNENLTRAVDKYLFKGYIAEKLGEGYTIPYYGVYDSVKSLIDDWSSLPDTFILKSTVQSDGRFIKVIHNKSAIDPTSLKRELKEWLIVKNTLVNSYCRAYYGAVPRIIAEKYVEQIDNQLFDYKIFCFKGVPYCAYAAMDHFKNGTNSNEYPISFYDMEWNLLDVQYGNHKIEEIPKPIHFEQMKEIAKKLSEEFPFVRVDFFDTEEKLYIAELTFYPGGGNTGYHPLDFDEELGKNFILPI